jgi:hypothetical protein
MILGIISVLHSVKTEIHLLVQLTCQKRVQKILFTH